MKFTECFVVKTFLMYCHVSSTLGGLSFTVVPRKVDPEITMTASQLITSKGYPCEEHYVVTKDGFILNLQRIPHGLKQKPGGPAVLVQHGLLASSSFFLTNLANESLPFLLADAGMDVWLGNSRGNTYSRNHTHLNPSQKEFWEWSWDQMAAYDLPAMVDYLVKTTGFSQVYYIGHSQGTTIAFAGLSTNPDLRRKIKTFFALAPVGTVEHIKGPLRLLAPFVHELEALLGLLGIYELLPKNPIFTFLARTACRAEPVICEDALFLIAGFDYSHTNKTRMPVYVSHSFAGTSTFNLLHFAQEVKSGKFQKYDYGSPSKNYLHYNQSTPPVYDPSKVTIPVAIFTGGRDWLADPKDVPFLLERLPNVVLNKDVPGWNHLDFAVALDAPELCYSDIIKFIKSQEDMNPEILVF